MGPGASGKVMAPRAVGPCMRLARRPHVVLLLAFLVLAPLGGARAWGGAPTEVFDPAHDVALYRNGVNLAVDATDVLHASLDDADGAVRGARIRVYDLGRAGFEDVLFARQHAHTGRVWGVLAPLEDGTVLVTLGVRYEPPVEGWSEGGIALRVHPDGRLDNLSATFTLDLARDTVAWDFGTPVALRPTLFVSFGATYGCDDAFATCEAPARVSGADAAPDGGSTYLANVQTFTWWSQVLPANDEASPLHEARAALVDLWRQAS